MDFSKKNTTSEYYNIVQNNTETYDPNSRYHKYATYNLKTYSQKIQYSNSLQHTEKNKEN